VLMQRILDGVVRGYCWHTSGTVPPHKAGRVGAKFAERYGVDRNSNQRAYARRRGRANARLFLLGQSGQTDLGWWLCVTEGTGCVHAVERLADAREKRSRIRIADDYELVRRTRSRARGGGVVWTWRMTRECYALWRERIIAACRRRDSLQIGRTVSSLYRMPGFSGIREQVGTLAALARSEWRRRHGNLDGLLLPHVLPCVERLPDTAVPLTEWCCGRNL